MNLSPPPPNMFTGSPEATLVGADCRMVMTCGVKFDCVDCDGDDDRHSTTGEVRVEGEGWRWCSIFSSGADYRLWWWLSVMVSIDLKDHVDPAKEEQLKWTIIETDTKVTRIVKLIKGIFGNREVNQTKSTEALDLIEDFHNQYQSMCAMYEDLKGVKKKCNNEEDKEDNESSTSSSSNSLSMESAGYFSPGSGSKTPSLDNIPKAAATTTDAQSMKSENSCYSLEDVSEVVKETLSVEPVWSSYKPEEREEEESGREVEKLMKENGDLRDKLGEKENKYQNLENKSSRRMKELEDKVVALKHEIEELNHQEREGECKGRHDELHKRKDKNKNMGFQIESAAFKEKASDVLMKLDECEKILKCKIDESMGRVQNVRKELDLLRSGNDEDRKKLLYEKEKEVESLRIQNQASEMELKGKIVQSMERVKNMQMELDSLRHQNNEARKKFLHENEKDVQSLRIQKQETEMEIKEKTEKVVDEFENIFKGKIVQSMDRLQNMQMEVESLRSQNVDVRKKLYEKEKEVESLSIRNKESESELKKKSKEAADSLEVVEKLSEKLQQTSFNQEDLKQQVNDSSVMIARINVENEKQQTTISQLNDENEKQQATISQLNHENEKHKTRIAQLNNENEKQKSTISQLNSQHENQKATISKLDNENERQKSTILQLNDQHEKQKATISQLSDESEKQKTTISQLNAQHEKQKATISQLNNENEKQKATILHSNDQLEKQKAAISQLMDEHEKQKATNSQLNGDTEKQKATISRLNGENEKQKSTISQLEKKLQAKETQITNLETKSEGVKKELSNKVKTLEHKFRSMEMDKKELEVKNDVLAVTLEQKDMQADKINEEVKSTFRAAVKKMGDMMTEFRKCSEDNILILSRRIHVAEQLQNETREWCKKTKDKYEQDKMDSDTNVRTIKVLMTMVNETLKVTEALGLRFVECCETFMNRVSKVSCEINSAKDWVRRKNVAMVQLKEDLDAVVVELDGKEEEVLRSRQKVLKLDTKLRDLEKTVKENHETIIVLKEEKREAIRHLCVWTDYHRSRADFLTKSLSDLLARNHRPV
ncbi:unnamed protein product [Lactuca virosa]|uniref:NAB domain-containing protein n=1 Tax=Lactuca virosa TaxID=75947 RepID=A0AAU9NA06_9ASTR|nr:unnamed protein product [Lactuca virosa]